MKRETISLRNRIIIPLLLALSVLLGAFILNTYIVQQKEKYEIGEKRKESVQSLFASKVKDDANTMSAALKIIVQNEKLQAAMRAEDRSSLLSLGAPLFKQLRANHKVTHFYFHEQTRKNLLRLHKPDKFGDEIDRFTMQQAVESGKESYGIELGPLGTFTLRVVTPWQVGEEIIGYIELGEEIDHILQGLHEIMNVEYVVVVDKKYIERKSWEEGLTLLGRKGAWDQFPSTVIIAKSINDMPESLSRHFMTETGMESIADREVQIEGRHYYANSIKLRDAGNRHVGEMIIFVDMTEILGTHNVSILIHVVLYSLVGIALFVFFRKVNKHVEKYIADAKEKILMEVEERKFDGKGTCNITSLVYPILSRDTGLIIAVEWYVKTLLEPAGVEVFMECDDTVETLPQSTQSVLFSIIREAFQNIIKYAAATEVTVTCGKDNGVMRLMVRDNGVGFAVEEVKASVSHGLGQSLMREWGKSIGGELSIRSEPGKGTEIHVEFPAVDEVRIKSM